MSTGTYTYGVGGSYVIDSSSMTDTITLGPTTDNTYTYNTYTYPNTFPNNNNLSVKGDAEFEGDVKIKGKSILDSLEKIEEKLAILRPNPELEEKWEELRGLRKMYMDLEKEIIEKEKMWDMLKK